MPLGARNTQRDILTADGRWQTADIGENEWVMKQHADIDLAVTEIDSTKELRLITNNSGFAVKSLPWASSAVDIQKIAFVPGKPLAVIPIRRGSLIQIILFNFETFESRSLASLPLNRSFDVIRFAVDGSWVIVRATGLHRNFQDLFKFAL